MPSSACKKKMAMSLEIGAPPTTATAAAPVPETQTIFVVFFFNDTATTEIYTLSLHDALPIRCARPSAPRSPGRRSSSRSSAGRWRPRRGGAADRKSTRLNSSHGYISYAVFCLKKKNKHTNAHYKNNKNKITKRTK